MVWTREIPSTSHMVTRNRAMIIFLRKCESIETDTDTNTFRRVFLRSVMTGGGRMYFSNQEMLMRKKLEEEADYNFRQALELHSRRLMNLQLQDLKNHPHHHHYNHPHRHHHYHHDLSNGSPLSSPTIPRSPNFQFSNHHQHDPASREISESMRLNFPVH